MGKWLILAGAGIFLATHQSAWSQHLYQTAAHSGAAYHGAHGAHGAQGVSNRPQAIGGHHDSGCCDMNCCPRFLQRLRDWLTYRCQRPPRECRGRLFVCGRCYPPLYSFFSGRYCDHGCGYGCGPNGCVQGGHFQGGHFQGGHVNGHRGQAPVPVQTQIPVPEQAPTYAPEDLTPLPALQPTPPPPAAAPALPTLPSLRVAPPDAVELPPLQAPR